MTRTELLQMMPVRTTFRAQASRRRIGEKERITFYVEGKGDTYDEAVAAAYTRARRVYPLKQGWRVTIKNKTRSN